MSNNLYAGALAKFNASYNPNTWGAPQIGSSSPVAGILGGAANGIGNMMKNPYFAKMMVDKLKGWQNQTQQPAPVENANITQLPNQFPSTDAVAMPIEMPTELPFYNI